MAKQKGKTVLPNSSTLWELLTNEELGFTLRLHRAIQSHGDRERGQLSKVEVKAMAKEHGALNILISLMRKGVLIAEADGDAVRITSWSQAQGLRDSKTREAAKDRARRMRARQDGCHALHGDNPPEPNGNPPDCVSRSSNDAPLPSSPHTPLLPSPSNSSSPSLLKKAGGMGIDTGEQGDLLDGGPAPSTIKLLELWTVAVPFNDLKKPREFAEKLERAYPLVNLREETYRIEAWWEANPGKRKTKRGLKRFVNLWFSRAQDQEEKDRREANAERRRGEDHTTSTVHSVWGKGKIS